MSDNADGSTITYDVSGSTPGSSMPGTPAPPLLASAQPGTPAPPLYEIDTPSLSVLNNGFCIAVTKQWTPNAGQASTALAASEPQWLVLVSQYPLCPGVQPPPPAAAGVSPAMIAAAFWQTHGQDLLGAPRPSVPPGYALSGQTAYLETGAGVVRQFTNPTPAGALRIVAQGEFWVDWGDGGSLTGPYHDSGGPYPNGDITHIWDTDGAYTVTVFERWTATWALAGQQGELTALQTVGTLPDLPVRQLESVRNR